MSNILGPLMCVLLAAPGYGLAQDWTVKAEAQSQKLAKFVPDVVPGLGDSLPWSLADKSLQTGYACSETGCTGLFAPITAHRLWSFDDPALVRQIAELDKKGDALLKADLPEPTEAAQKNQAAMDELQAKFAADLEKLIAKMTDPKVSPKEQEQMSVQFEALQKKNVQDQNALSGGAGEPAFMKEAREIDAEKQKLERGSRFLEFTIEGNATPDWCSGDLSSPVKSGTVKGRPVYRFTSAGGAGNVCLAVYLGPDGFKNPAPPKDGKLNADLKTIFVKARVSSTPQSVKADEAAARQLLETIDYDGLAKLVQP